MIFWKKNNNLNIIIYYIKFYYIEIWGFEYVFRLFLIIIFKKIKIFWNKIIDFYYFFFIYMVFFIGILY